MYGTHRKGILISFHQRPDPESDIAVVVLNSTAADLVLTRKHNDIWSSVSAECYWMNIPLHVTLDLCNTMTLKWWICVAADSLGAKI